MNFIKRVYGSIRYRYGIYRITWFNFLRQNLVWYSFIYKVSTIYFRIVSRNYHFKRKSIDFNSIKSVALIYSKKHFNPKNDDELSIKTQYSASNIAREIYSVFKGKEIHYFDHSQPISKSEMPKVDLVLGVISKNYLKVASANKQANKILFLVNCHPLYRLKILISESRLLKKTFPYSEYVSPIFFMKLCKYVDSFIMIGNDFVKSTFTDYKIPDDSIEMIDTGMNNLLAPDFSKRPKNKIRVIYVGSHLAIRKGLFRVMQVWDLLMKDKNNDFELIIIGSMDSFKSEMNDFVKRHNNVKYLGWIESTTESYKEYIQSSHILLNLSIEEGQVGCVLDGMACATTPVITDESGVSLDKAREGFIVDYKDIKGIVKIINELKDFKKREEIERNVLKLVKEKYNWDIFRKKFKESLNKN